MKPKNSRDNWSTKSPDLGAGSDGELGSGAGDQYPVSDEL